MKRFTMTAIAVLSVLLVAGCSKRIPKGSSPEVKELVLGIARDYYRDQLAAVSYQRTSGVPIGIIGIHVDYNWLCERARSEDSAKEALQALDEAMQRLTFSVENVRTEDVDNEVGRIACACDIRIGATTDSVSFTAQYNEDGELYVEVSGLGKS